MKVVRVLIFVVVVLLIFGQIAQAKISKELKTEFESRFTPAIPHKGLETGAFPLEVDKLRTFVVVKRGGLIPAERAFYLISPGEYDYRGSTIRGDRVKTRMGKPYIYLPIGTVMAVAEDVFAGRTIFIKIISMTKMPSDIFPKKKATHVTAMVGFKFDKSILEGMNVGAIYQTIQEWVEPFDVYKDALKYSETILLPKDNR